VGRVKVNRSSALTFGERVRAQRELAGRTQRQVAERAHVEVRYLSDVERGLRNVGLENIVRIAYGLDVDPAVLVSGLEPTWG
jgi:transcriptional regulator with XRE-family HTH domain